MGIFHPRTGLGGSVGITNYAGVGNISCKMPLWEDAVDAVGNCRLPGMKGEVYLGGARSRRNE